MCGSLVARLNGIDDLVIDDWSMAPLSEPERRDFREICEDGCQARLTILTSQLPGLTLARTDRRGAVMAGASGGGSDALYVGHSRPPTNPPPTLVAPAV